MKKILITTGSTGGGHNSTAKNLKEILEESGFEVELFDIAEENNLGSQYDFVLKYLSGFYELLYKTSNNEIINVLNNFLVKETDRFLNKVLEYKPDLILSVHALTISIMKRLRKKKLKIKEPFIQVITDFIPHHVYYDEEIVDAYITGSEYTNFEIAKKGVPFFKTYDYGIPISKKFIGEYDYNIKRHIMIMLGSMGFSLNIDNILNLIKTNDDLTYSFITGKNEGLKLKLEEEFREKIENKQLEVFGYINNVNEIMKKSDIIITKPGGLSITECINMRKPMILVNPIPGQEEENIKVMEIYGIGINGVNKDLNKLLMDIYSDENNLNSMIKGIEKLARNYSKKKMVELVNSLIEGE